MYSSIKSAVLARLTLAGVRANAQVTGDTVRIHFEHVECIRDDKTKGSDRDERRWSLAYMSAFQAAGRRLRSEQKIMQNAILRI